MHLPTKYFFHQQKIRTGMMQIKRNIQDRMSIDDVDTAIPIQIINQRPLQARIKEFFTTNQLSQFMAQENVLYEMEHFVLRCLDVHIGSALQIELPISL
jgi:DNA-directed RNA polymerase beta subunit